MPDTPNVGEPEGAWAYLRSVVDGSDPARTGPPEFSVTEPLRTALATALVDADDIDAEAEALRERLEKWRGLLTRAIAVCAGPAYARLRKDIEAALKTEKEGA